ncbi:MAG: leucine-rich repeat protein [Oscillospiraceae bacterium]|nr:leucine-rich repeat protein [Oscillospiraceae bacterium]
MRKLVCFSLCFLMIFSLFGFTAVNGIRDTVPVFALDETTYNNGNDDVDDDVEIEFVVESGVLKKYIGTESDLIIPNSMNIVRIGEGVFSGDEFLESVVLPASVKSIGMGAFEDCELLVSVTLPNGLNEIESSVFAGCVNLLNIKIPGGVTVLGNAVFADCESLISIEVEPQNSYYSSSDGVLFNKNKSILIFYPPGKTADFYTVPNTVQIIDIIAFSKNEYLERLNIPSSVTEIHEEAFYESESLIIYCKRDSAAHDYAEEFDIQYILIDGYKVTFYNEGKKIGKTQTVAYGDSAKAPANPKRSGYIFWRWDISFKDVTEDLEINAEWKRGKSKVLFKAAGKTKVVRVKTGGKVKSYTPVRSGFAFAGWYQDKKLKRKFNFNRKIEGSVSIYAKFLKRPSAPAQVSASVFAAGVATVKWKAQRGFTYVLEVSSKSRNSGFKPMGTTKRSSWLTPNYGRGRTIYYRVKRFNKTIGKNRIFSLYSKTGQIRV